MVVTHGHLSQLWANMFLSMASLILLMKLRFLYQEIQRRMKRHRNYVMVNQTLQERCSLSLSLYRPRKALNIISITAQLQHSITPFYTDYSILTNYVVMLNTSEHKLFSNQ